jgi:serine/threonine-protein kinase HipA
LSPAYDLTPMNPVSLERRDLAMICGNAGCYANGANLNSQSARFLLNPQEAERLVNEMADSIAASWYEIARSEGESDSNGETIKGALVYAGFWY